MAIAATTYNALLSIRDLLPQGGRILEIGEANWYGDMHPVVMLRDLHRYVTDGGVCEDLQGELIKLLQTEPSPTFDIAKLFYRMVFGSSDSLAIDLNGTDAARKLDLNTDLWPLDGGPFQVVWNHGTAEHVFNIAQVFRTMHDHCAVGGVMIHDSPFTGFHDHGFYNLNPTLFYDVAWTNHYEIVGMFLGDFERAAVTRVFEREQFHWLVAHKLLPASSSLLTVLRKRENEPFRVPMQAVYDNRLSDAGQKAWEQAR